jgi:outer membrane lipoprotein-sorting protein
MIVILNVQSDSAALSDYIIDELIGNAVNDRIFKVVDRQQLDLIRTEQNFQLSGEVDDNLALSIGKFFGAQTIVSGKVSQVGDRYRMTIRALEVQTAQIQGQYNRNIAAGTTITALMASGGSSSRGTQSTPDRTTTSGGTAPAATAAPVPAPSATQNASATAVSIMDSTRTRIKQETISSRSRMVITAKDGTTTERVIDQYFKDGPNGGRTVIAFQRPATVAGIRFLTMNTTSGTSEHWIFLPGLGKVRRISASEGSDSFMGTNFSYDDFSFIGRDVSLDTHTLLREESLNGILCYVIQSIPASNSYQYSKTVSWVDKSNYMIYKSEMYNRRGELAKVMEMSEYRDAQGRLTPMQTKITTVSAGTSTTIRLDILKYDDPIPEGVFTTAYLETGRVPR